MHDFKREGETESSSNAVSQGQPQPVVQAAWLPAGMLCASRQFCLGPTSQDCNRLL